jgi:hypothetical protein
VIRSDPKSIPAREAFLDQPVRAGEDEGQSQDHLETDRDQPERQDWPARQAKAGCRSRAGLSKSIVVHASTLGGRHHGCPSGSTPMSP